MALREVGDEREPVRRRRVLRWLLAAGLPPILAACAAKSGGRADPRMGQGAAGHGDGGDGGGPH